MASDLSSECTETIGVLDEKEEGEISLEDVSSSEEGHLNYGYGSRVSQCSTCLSTQHHATWCTASTKFYPSKGSANRREVDLILQDAVQGKENRHQIKESGCTGTKHTVSTLQEKNDDLVPISSDSDMEIVGLVDNSKQIIIHTSSKSRVKKKRKKERNHVAVMSLDDLVSSSTVDMVVSDDVASLKLDVTKANASRSHHRETSPVHKNSRSRVITRSPPRKHRSLIRARSPFRRSKSPVIRARSPIRRSPRRLKSPKRSPYRSSGKTVPRKTSHPELMSPHSYTETHKLLKKVRKLDSIGTKSLKETLNKNKEHASSLKEKLTNMMKVVSDNNSDITNSSKEKSTDYVNQKEFNDADDEEDLALLRQKALETKQNKSNKPNDQSKSETGKKVNANINDDEDEEDLELRMIALRSAVIKKHQNRVQKGIKSRMHKKSNISRSESPFTQSFLDSIPIPGEELLNFASPPHTPLPMNENNHTEDMDLDTDVEREKEKLPYSPTDKITASIPMDTELLGIQPSDVSFISLNEINNSPSYNVSMVSNQDNQSPYSGKIIENRSYLPNVVYYSPLQNSISATTNVNMHTTSKTDFIKVHGSRLNEHHYGSTCNVSKGNVIAEFMDTNSSQEMPYSPTDTPIYDPDLSTHALPQTVGPITTSNPSLVPLEPYNPNVHGNSEQCSQTMITQQTLIKQINDAVKDEQINKAETLSLEPAVGSATTSLMESMSLASSMVTVDNLPEIDADTSLFAGSVTKPKSTNNIPGNSNGVKKLIPEPLYMKGIPDITKDANKIPTLINRTLVPASILKTNKQLQQPLSVKKSATQQEPTFKSAEMQPVIINEETTTKINTAFKPMKLISFPQKSHSVLAVPTVFNDSLNEELTDETVTNQSTSLTENTHNATANTEDLNKTCDSKSSTQKKKKRTRRGGIKRRNAISVLSATKKLASSINNANTNIIDKKINNTFDDKQDTDKIERQDVRENTVASVSEASQNVTNHTNVKNTSSNKTLQEIKNVENRRESVDEDEEALRAILLASLPKRTKPTNNVPSSTVTTTLSVTSTVSTQVLANRAEPKVASSMTNTVNTVITNSTTVGSINAYGSENDKNQSNSKDKVSNIIPRKDLPVESVKTVDQPMIPGRKRSLTVIKGPQKKLMKKIAIPASTKVVNNAKKYQNSMLQRKLNLQKAVYNKQKIAGNKITSTVPPNDTKWSTNTKTLLDTQRIVINLESDSDSDSESEQQKNKTVSATNSPTVEKAQSATNSTAEFEKNLEQFLRAVRKRQESMAATRPTSVSQTSKNDTLLNAKAEQSNSSNLHTPLAVRHLPASQQEEYRRLKQQILEREKKLHKTIETNASTKTTSTEVSSKLVQSNSPNKKLYSKVNQTVFTKSQTINVQLNKENCSKNLDSVKNTSVMSTNNIQLSVNKSSMDKQGTINPKQTRTMANLNIRVSTENNPNKIAGNFTQSENTTRKVFEIPAMKVQTKTKLLPDLKILSTEEVNRKYVQIQLKNDTNERVVTINDKVTLNNKTVIDRNENVSENNDNGKNDANQVVQSVGKEDTPSSNNDAVDSDASTVILRKENQNEKGTESNDTSESTVRLSDYQNDSRTTSMSTENKDDSPSLMFNNKLGDKISIEENWEVIKRDVKTELNTLISLSREEQERRLIETEQELVTKRYTILDDLTEMSSNIRQWHMERDLQANLAAEVKKLREQLKVAEERLQVQRDRINNIGPKVVAAHGKINVGRKECFKLVTICSTLGNKVVGQNYKVPEAGAQLLTSKLKEVANRTRQLSKKKVLSVDIPEVCDSTKLEEETVSTACTELSQNDSLLLEECNVNNVDDTTILNETEGPTKSDESENAASLEVTTVENIESNDLINDDQSIRDQNNTEKKAFSDQSKLNDTHDTTTSISNTKDAQDRNPKESLESNTAKPGSSEVCNKKSSKEPQTKKTLLPYESMLVHFQVPRNTNPNGILCPYELMGTCSDGDCQFIHQRDSQVK